MKAPNVTILGQPYKVIEVAHVIDDGDDILLGKIEYEAGELYLATHAADYILRDTYLHEVLHGVFYKAHLPTQTEDHEDMIERITPILLQMLRENPRAVEYLIGRQVGRAGGRP